MLGPTNLATVLNSNTQYIHHDATDLNDFELLQVLHITLSLLFSRLGNISQPSGTSETQVNSLQGHYRARVAPPWQSNFFPVDTQSPTLGYIQRSFLVLPLSLPP